MRAVNRGTGEAHGHSTVFSHMVSIIGETCACEEKNCEVQLGGVIDTAESENFFVMTIMSQIKKTTSILELHNLSFQKRLLKANLFTPWFH